MQRQYNVSINQSEKRQQVDFQYQEQEETDSGRQWVYTTAGEAAQQGALNAIRL